MIPNQLSQLVSQRGTVLGRAEPGQGNQTKKDSPCLVVLRLSHNSFTRGFGTVGQRVKR
jgi:hypothetical protein